MNLSVFLLILLLGSLGTIPCQLLIHLQCNPLMFLSLSQFTLNMAVLAVQRVGLVAYH
jgi:hypothetical protein